MAAGFLLYALLGGCLGAWLAACGEEAPDQREGPPPPKPHADGGEPEMQLPYDGTCSGITCPATGLGSPGCCTRKGTGQEGNQLANVGRGAELCGTDIGLIVPSLRGICLQLSQPGEVDDDCPPQVSIAGGDARPGCCTDEGFCGSLDEFVPLGCFYATGLKGRRCTTSSTDGGDAGAPERGEDSGVSAEDGGA